jgi:putative ABC transport system permease protein
VDALLRDLRYALRQLRRSPGYSAAAVLTLALGIGANTAVFSLVNGVLLRPLPYAEPERLYTLFEQRPAGEMRLASYPTFLDWKNQSDAFAGLAYIRGQTVIFRGPDGPEQLVAGYVSDGFLATVGEQPLLGRGFLPDEQRPGAAPAAILSYGLWQRRFGGDSAVLGRPIALGDVSATVVGVMPRGFAYPEWATLWLPLSALPSSDRGALTQRGNHADSRVLGRLGTGVDRRRAEAELGAVAARLAAAYPEESGGWSRVRLSPLSEQVLGDAQPRLLLLAAAVGLVLLIGCANLINLSLARATARSRELAIRAALGGGRGRLIRQLLIEGLVLALLGGGLGALLAAVAVDALRSAAHDVLPRLDEVSVDGTVLAFALATSVLAALVFGLLPALRASSVDLSGSLKDGGHGSGSGARRTRLRSALVVAELTVALVLLTGAGLLLKSFWRLEAVSPGFEPARLVTVRVIPPARYDDPARALALYRRLAETVAAVPGVESVALTNHVPLTGASIDTRLVVAGRAAGADSATALFRTVSPEYFRTMQIPLLRGRVLTEADMTGSSAAVLVNQALVRRYWPHDDPLGKRLTVFKSVQARPDFGQPVEAEVVGVVGDVRHYGLDAGLTPEVYLPYTVNPPRWISLVIRTRSQPELTIPALRRAVLAVEPDLPVTGDGLWAGFATVDQFLSASLAPRRFNTVLLGGFAAAAVLLAVIGLYGVLAYLVAQRTREMGVRVALGAQPGDVLRLTLGRGIRLTLLGLGLGLLGALLLTRVMASLLYGVTATDPATFAAVAALLAVVALLASYLPARRAARVDPVVALRSE